MEKGLDTALRDQAGSITKESKWGLREGLQLRRWREHSFDRYAQSVNERGRSQFLKSCWGGRDLVDYYLSSGFHERIVYFYFWQGSPCCGGSAGILGNCRVRAMTAHLEGPIPGGKSSRWIFLQIFLFWCPQSWRDEIGYMNVGLIGLVLPVLGQILLTVNMPVCGAEQRSNPKF